MNICDIFCTLLNWKRICTKYNNDRGHHRRMRILGQNPADNSISIRLETDDDSWHLYNVVEVGDLVTASTTRREEKSADKINNERMEKKRMTLGVRVEKIEFSEDDMRIKLLGTI